MKKLKKAREQSVKLMRTGERESQSARGTKTRKVPLEALKVVFVVFIKREVP